MIMKWLTIVCFIISLLCSNCERSQRLMLPSTASLMKIIPRIEMPMVSSNSIQSGFSLKMPIAIQFPSMLDVVQSIRNTVNGGINGNNIPQRFPVIATETLSLNKSRVNSRAKLYKTIENSHKSLGKVCLMRAICEVAEVPFISASTGLIGEIIDLLLTTSIMGDESGLLSTYREAEMSGRKGFGKGDACKSKYKQCPLSLFNLAELPIIG